ncbi:MAG: caspase family protein, partial [Myxococcota bacterium]
LTDLGHDAGCVPLSLDFSPNNERLAAGCSDGVRLVSVATGLQTQHLRGTAEPVRSASLSPDGRWMASLSNTTIAVWDMQALRLRHTLDLGPLRGLRYTPTGHLMTLGLETIDIRSDRTGKVIRSFRRPKKWSHPPSFSPDGQRMAVYTPSDQKFGTRTGTVTVWTLDQEGGRPGTRSFRIHMGLGRLVFGPQGQRIAAVMGQGRLDNKAIGIWDIASGRLVKTLRYDASDTFEPKEAYLSDLAWSPDGSVVVASAGAPNQLVVWDPTTGRQLKTLRTGKLKALTFSTDGRRLAATVSASNTREGRVVVWEIPSWTQPASVEGGSPAQFFPDAKRMLTGYRGGLRLWTLEETTPQSLHLRSRGRSWIVYGDDGTFDAARRGGELVAMVAGLRGFGLEQFALERNRPDLLLERFGLGEPEQIAWYRNRHERRQTLFARRLEAARVTQAAQTSGCRSEANVVHVPNVEVTGWEHDGRRLTLTLNAHDERCPLVAYQIFINGSPLFKGGGQPLSGQTQTATATITLSTGANAVEVSVTNAAGVESYRVQRWAEVSEPLPQPPDLYFVGFGNSDYTDPNIPDLKFAHQDVLDLEQVFAQMAGTGGIGQVHHRSYVGAAVTPKAIEEARCFLGRAREDDQVVVFIAGHGMYTRDDSPTYHYLTHRTALGALRTTAVPFETLEGLMEGLHARNKLLLMDTCESGELDDAWATWTASTQKEGMHVRGFRPVAEMTTATPAQPRPWLLERDRYINHDILRSSGAVVFSSSRGGESSYENDTLGNGVFTEELVRALTTTVADTNNDGQLSVEELRSYVSTAVPKRYGVPQHPVVDRDNLLQATWTFPIRPAPQPKPIAEDQVPVPASVSCPDARAKLKGSTPGGSCGTCTQAGPGTTTPPWIWLGMFAGVGWWWSRRQSLMRSVLGRYLSL